MESFADILDLYRRGCMREAEAACENLLAASNDHADAHQLLADIQLSSGRIDVATSNLRALTRLRPGDAANHRRFGGALLSLGKAAEAADVLRRAIELEPDSVRAHNNLGQALLQSEAISEAIRHFEFALELNPNYAIGFNNLGLALTSAGKFARAVAAFQRAIDLDASLNVARFNLAIGFERMGCLSQALDVYDRILASGPPHVDALSGRGAVLAALNRTQAALESFDAALKLRPDDAATRARIASLLLSSDRAAEALLSADHALRLREDFGEALNIKAGALCKLNRPADALRCINRALELDPPYVEGWCTSALVHQNLGDHASAATSYRRALSLDPACIVARTGLISASIPSVPASAIEEVQARIAFDRELTAFEAWLGERDLVANDAWTVARQQFFYLSYQEQSNKAFLRRYRTASARQLAGVERAYAPAPSVGTSSGRFQLGIVSAHVFDHSVFSAMVQGWLRQLDRKEFEITLFSLGTKRDTATEAAGRSVDRFEGDPRSAVDWARLIGEGNFGALLFPEVGMDPTTLAIANLRLAPQQYAAWGHPETTGLPTIDYFLSADALEPPDAEDHYSEKLIRLPHLGVYYQPHGIAPAAVDFAELGITADGPVFVCPGTPFKYRPEDDALLVDIAQRLGHCTFIFFSHDKVELSNKLRARLAAAFERAGLEPGRHLVWIPWLPRPAFFGLMRQADVYLDTIGFSGFNTLMQAVEVQLPAVAYEGRFLRGRLGSGILRRLGLPELVAEDRAQYVDIAVRLAKSPQRRAELRSRLRSLAHRAYFDTQPVDALARALVKPPSH
jgi:protein O-GlcNAc transferase